MLKFLFSLGYIYVVIYTFYLFVLSIKNLNNKPFLIEKKYSKYDSVKRNFAVVIYSHNHRDCLERLVEQFKMQDYPLANFKVYAILDDCNDGSETLFENDKFVHVVNFQDVGLLGKNEATSLLLQELSKNDTIDAYIFIDSFRVIESNFLTLANASLISSDAITGELNINRENLDIVDKIKAVRKKYQANFFKQARTLLGLSTQIDSGLLIIKKQVVDGLDDIYLQDVNNELELSLILSKKGYKCVYNPNIQSYILGQDCRFAKSKLSKRFDLFKSHLKQIKGINFTYIEHLCSLIAPNCWTLILAYLLLIVYSYNFEFIVKCNVVIFSALFTLLVFCLSLVNAKMSGKEIFLLMFYPLYSICHIIKNLPPIRSLLKKIGASSDKEVDKLRVEALVLTNNGDRACLLDFISTENGLCKIRFTYKNKKYTTGSHLRMIDALQQLKSKMSDYGLVLKICSCCKYFSSSPDGTKNLLKGACHNDFPSPLLLEHRHTLIWNSCSGFEPSNINNIIEEIAQAVEHNN